MEREELRERLWAIAERFFPRPEPTTILSDIELPFDIDSPVLHDSKKDFEAEVKELLALKDACSSIISIVGRISGREGEAAQHRARAIIRALDNESRKKAKPGPFEDPYELLRAVAAQHSQCYTALFLAYDLEWSIDVRLQHLETQRLAYWNQPHRAPNHYARTIALRFAKVIALNTGKRPTFGLARDGNHPSTDFGRALEEVFGLLGIASDVRRPAEWAIGQLKDEDLVKPTNALFSLGLGIGNRGFPDQSNGLMNMLRDRSGQTAAQSGNGAEGPKKGSRE